MTTPNTTLLDPWLEYLMHYKATDLHVSSGSVPRVRIDGKLFAITDQPPTEPATVEAMVTGLLDHESREAYEAVRQHDFAFTWHDRARFRANAYTQLGAPALALRLIPTEIPTPEQLALPDVCRSLVVRPFGLVLVTGPTGSGKSTTLAAMIGWINQHRPCHILTIEDPVEYVHPSSMALVNQREVGADCMSFSDALRAALREDPDVVLVGEMRDLETISHTLTLAETGHLVFATLHTNDASQISQRLIPKIGGGRVAAHEVLVGTSAVGNLIREGKVRQMRNLISTSQRDGMFVLEQSLSRLVSGGLISMEDAMEASVHPEDIASLAQRQA